MAALRRPAPRVADAHGGIPHIGDIGSKTALSMEARDVAWLSRLGRSRSSRALQDHLACMEDRLNSRGREGSIKEAIGNRESFLSALNRSCANGKPYPCGLPETLPRYIAIVNLSGQRMLLTSESDALMRKLCAHSWGLHPDCLTEQLAQVVHYLNRQTGEGTNPSTTGTEEAVLITYSLPWQAGISSAYWELNTIRVTTSDTGQRRVRDRELSFSSMSTCLFEDARPTLCNAAPGAGITIAVGTASAHTLRFVPDEQIDAFVGTHRAVDLDAPAHPSTCNEAERGAGSSAAVDAVLRSTLAAMELGRKKDQDEIHALKVAEKELKLAHATALAKENERAMECIEKVQAEIKGREKVAEDKVAANWKEVNMLRTSNIALLTEIDETLGTKLDIEKRMEKLKKQELSKDKLHNAASSKQAAEIKKLTDRIEVQERLAAQQIAELNRTHSHAIEQLEAKAETKRAALQETLSWKEKVCNQLVENNDGKLAELEDARERLSESRARILELGAENVKLRQTCQEAESAAPKSIGCGTTTQSQGTSTHHHNGTQTGNGCIMAEDLPEELQAALPEPPPWAVAAAPSPTLSSPTAPSPVLAPTPVAVPAPMVAPASVAMPVPMAAPMQMNIPDSVVPQPFGTPQMAMNAAMSSLGHLLSWTQFLEADATQRHAQAHMNQHLMRPQHLVHPQPQPHRGRH